MTIPLPSITEFALADVLQVTFVYEEEIHAYEGSDFKTFNIGPLKISSDVYGVIVYNTKEISIAVCEILGDLWAYVVATTVNTNESKQRISLTCHLFDGDKAGGVEAFGKPVLTASFVPEYLDQFVVASFQFRENKWEPLEPTNHLDQNTRH